MSTSLAALSASQLLKVYNHHAPKPVARFESTASGVKRLSKLLATIEVSADDAIDAVYPAKKAKAEAPAPVVKTARTLRREAAEAEVAKLITVRYSAVDGFSDTRKFKTLAGAQAYAQKRLGQHPDLGRGYAVSEDGVGKVTVSGRTLAEIFPDRTAEDEIYGLEAPALVLARDELRSKTAKAAKAAKAAPGLTVDTGRKPTAKDRILNLIMRPTGATETEVCAELGWVKAGATIGRAIKAATFTVRKEKVGRETRYFRGEAR